MQNHLIIKKSSYSVSSTIDKITTFLNSKEATIFVIIDHSEEAKVAGLELKEEKLIIFGNPKIGTLLMQENPLIGLELPLKILVWNTDEGTQVAYHDPQALEKPYGITKNADLLKNISAALDHVISTFQ